VLFLRGSYLNPFEAQYLRPLARDFDLTLAVARSHRYDLSDVRLPQQTFACMDYLNGLIPRRVAGRAVPNPCKWLGYEEVLFGLGERLAEFDLVHVPEQAFFFSWQVAKQKNRLGFRMVTTQDELLPFWYARRPACASRAAEVRKNTNLFLARSERARQVLIAEGVAPERIQRVGHGIDTSVFCPGPRNTTLAASLEIDPDRFVVLFAGRLVRTKGIFTLVDAAALLARDPEFMAHRPLYLIVGDGDDRKGLEARVREYGLEAQFRFVRWQPYSALADLHRLADLFVCPSIPTLTILEQFGIVLLEAMATGTPVIAALAGAIDEVVGDAGELVPPNDFFRLSEAIRLLCLNEAARTTLGLRGLARVRERFSHEIVAAQLASAYRTALAR
jgi:glycosyltransferase involved in cell wall biosynthesis